MIDRRNVWAALNARYPLPERRRPIVSDNTVPHEGTIFVELGYVRNPETDEWQAPVTLAHNESACTPGADRGTPAAGNT